MILKIDDVTGLAPQQLQQFMQDGIALVKVSSTLTAQMKAVEGAAKQFFQQATAVRADGFQC